MASAKNSSKLNKFLHSEVNQIIQHIIVQDQDAQNNINLKGNSVDSRNKGRPGKIWLIDIIEDLN